jgi:outer membrane protein TolC
MGVQLQLPVFDGGRRSAHRKLSESQLRQAEIRAKDLRDQIELDVRVAVDNLASNQEQLRAAEEVLRLAQEETDLARLRFEAQVTTQIDVVNAQAELADARSRQVNALFALKSAQIEYQRATGLEIR